ncbi:MAG TPA: choice-of-anchor Q domain-containing protein, partial [Anaerolineales bacterium]|nr:choice-of-anchor Q domain-containing protein [Anaerolineales bacterium]
NNAGGYSGGGIYVGTSLTLDNSSITNNSGEGIHIGGGTINLNNSTISSNSGGGIYAKVEWGEFALTLNNVTISENTANQGGGLNVFGGNVTLQNSIIAGNHNAKDTNSPDCYGTIGSVGYNLIGNTMGCTFNAATGDLLNLDPRLFVLTGSPGYHPLFPDSPAINAGNPDGCTDHLGNPLDTDQRGQVRIGRCDMGAYEFDPDNNPLSSIYLPLVRRASAGINGRATLNGAPIAGVLLELRLIPTDSIVATTTTGSDGRYAFRNVPGLEPNQSYYVLYQNTQGTPGFLQAWETARLTSYTMGDEAAIGDFDIADIVLISPESGTSVSIPAPFQWLPRLGVPTDNYEFNLFDPNDYAPYFTAPSLGYVGSFTLDYLPEGFDPDTDYAWGIAIYGTDGGAGFSSTTRLVRFSDSNSMASPK